MKKTSISVITPSYNMLTYLQRCIASVEDQKGATYEHIVIDGKSTDDTVNWLQYKNSVKFISEKDKGMYDAINTGMKMANGDIIAYLNCDEQYLPGTLSFVQDFFDNNPDVDMIFGDSLIINPDGTLISYWKGYQPRWYYIMVSHLYVLSCTMFFRRKIIENGIFFNDKLKTVGDSDFVVRVLRQGYRVVHVTRYLTAFTYTGSNMSDGDIAKKESLNLKMSAPGWVRFLKAPLNVFRLTEKLISGAYWQKMPFSYQVYPDGENLQRKVFEVDKARCSWPKQEIKI